MFDALERGVAGGTISAPSVLTSFNLVDLVKYSTVARFTVASFFLVMNADKWQSLSAEDQRVLDAASGEPLAMHAARVGDATDRAATEVARARGVEFYRATRRRAAPLDGRRPGCLRPMGQRARGARRPGQAQFLEQVAPRVNVVGSGLPRLALRSSALLGGLMLAALVPLTVLDIALRYVLNAPIRGTFELTQLAMVGVAFLGLGEAQARMEHITIDLLHDAPSSAWARDRRALRSACQSRAGDWPSVGSSPCMPRERAAEGEVSGVLGLPLYLAIGVAAAGFVLFGLALVTDP